MEMDIDLDLRVSSESALDELLSRVEKVANYPGYVPFLSSVTGSARIKCGVWETIISLAIGIFKKLEYVFGGNHQLSKEAGEAFHYARHGLANILRGLIEIIPVVGNIACWIYDGKLMPFATTPHRMNYPTEVIHFRSQTV